MKGLESVPSQNNARRGWSLTTLNIDRSFNWQSKYQFRLRLTREAHLAAMPISGFRGVISRL